MENGYPFDVKSNSHKSKQEAKNNASDTEKRVEKVVKGPVKTKKNEMRKFKDVFISEDVKNVKSYIFLDVLVPAVKDALANIVTDGINMILYGESRRGSRKAGSAGNVSYTAYYNNKRSSNDYNTRTRSGFDYDDIVFSNRGEAEAVLTQMDELIDRYGVVRVADLYDMADLSAPFTSNKYGWTNIRNADVARVRDGYVIRLPKAMALD